jgi:hypothetical protein
MAFKSILLLSIYLMVATNVNSLFYTIFHFLIISTCCTYVSTKMLMKRKLISLIEIYFYLNILNIFFIISVLFNLNIIFTFIFNIIYIVVQVFSYNEDLKIVVCLSHVQNLPFYFCLIPLKHSLLKSHFLNYIVTI